MNFFIYKDFLNSLNSLHKKGQTFKSPYQRVFDVYINATNKQDFDSTFLGLKKTNHGEKRIKHAVKYDLGRGCRLITIQHKNKCVLLYAGEHKSADKWIEKNRGLSVVVGKDSGVITTLNKTKDGETEQRPITSQNPGSFKLIKELSDDDQALLLDGISSYPIIKRITDLSSWDTDDAVINAVEGIQDQNKSDLLIDVLLLLRDKKNKSKVTRRIDDYKGYYISLEDVANENLEICDGSDDVIKLKSIDVEATRLALESADYRSWMLYMHPDQEKIVEKDYNGPALLRGVSGSGKTAVVVNRAIRLAIKYPNEKIAVITLNKALAKLIEDLIKSSSKMKNITVKDFWHLCTEQLSIFEPNNDHHYEETTWRANETIDDIWQEYYHQETNNFDANVLLPLHQSLLARSIYPQEYIKEEFDFIRSALPTDKREDYLELEREGRSVPLPKDYRKLILQGLDYWELKMQAIGTVDYLGVTTALYKYIDKIQPKFKAILLDEMQDFGTLELEIIRKLAFEGVNDLFLAGDTVQRVHTKQHDYQKANINIIGRSMSIDQNYRNSREILEAANNVLEDNLTGTNYSAADAEIDYLTPKFANYSEFVPYILEAETLSEEITSAVQYLQEMLKEDGAGHNACIAVAGYQLSELKGLAEQLKIQLLDGEIDLQNKALFLSDLEQTKGFEFDHMIIVSCSEGILPNPNLPSEEAFRDLSRLYVAMTRARKNLIISFSGHISGFFNNSKEYFMEDKWKNHIQLKDSLQIKAPYGVGVSERFRLKPEEYTDRSEYQDLSGKELLLTRKSIGMSLIRQERLIKYITGQRKSAQSVKSNTWKNLSQLFSETQVVVNTILAGGNENVLDEVNYFKQLFNVEKTKRSKAPPSSNGDMGIVKNAQGDSNNTWSVIIENSGKCMHCGNPSIPGDYVCYNCNIK